MRKILSLAVLAVFCITITGIAFAADAGKKGKKLEGEKLCNVCEKGMKDLIIAHASADCPITAATIGAGCEGAFGPETGGAATIICGGVAVAVDVVCTEAGGVDKFKENADKYARKICEKVKACK